MLIIIADRIIAGGSCAAATRKRRCIGDAPLSLMACIERARSATQSMKHRINVQYQYSSRRRTRVAAWYLAVARGIRAMRHSDYGEAKADKSSLSGL